MTFDTLIAAMLDDPFAYVGSLGFDILVRLLTGNGPWRPQTLPGEPWDVGSLDLTFAKQSPQWHETLPPDLRNHSLSPEEAVCAAVMLSDAIAADPVEQKRWLDAVIRAADHVIPAGESPFTIHTSVYAQLARGWPKYAGNRTVVFSRTADAGSSGTDRFACTASKSDEFSARNVDAGEFRTSGYKTPGEVEAVMISASANHAGVGRRRLRQRSSIDKAGDRTEASFRAAFPSLNSTLDEIDDFEEAWASRDAHGDALAYPLPFDPSPLRSAFFRIRDPAVPIGRMGRGSMVAVLAPMLLFGKVSSIQTHHTRRALPTFVVADAPIGPDLLCTQCGNQGHKCHASQAAPSSTVVPIAGLLFRCSPFTTRIMASLGAQDKMTPSSLQGIMERVRAHSSLDHARICEAWESLDAVPRSQRPAWMLPELSGAQWSAFGNEGWEADLMARVLQLRLRSSDAVVGDAMRSSPDAICSLSLATVTRHESDHGLFRAMCSMPPAPPSPPPSPPASPPTCHPSRLSVCRCDALFSDRTSLLTRMWSARGWKQVVPGHPTDGACWGAGNGQAFFDRVISGRGCERNWYSAHPAKHVPKFRDDAPSVLGFDDDIKDYCVGMNREQTRAGHGYGRDDGQNASALPLVTSISTSGYEPPVRRRLGSGAQECARANRTILELNDDDYSSCANLEWQTCAAMGKVPGQRTARIVFANAPGEVDLHGRDGAPTLGACTGHAPYGCGRVGYANDDIFFLEVCIYSKICANRDELFRLEATELFTCQVSEAGVRELQKLLVENNKPTRS